MNPEILSFFENSVESLELCSADYKTFQKLRKRLRSRSKKFYGNLYRRADGTLYMYFEKSERTSKKNAAGDCIQVAVPIWLNVPKETSNGGTNDK